MKAAFAAGPRLISKKTYNKLGLLLNTALTQWIYYQGMEPTNYWSQYNLLRRNATAWDINYTRYTHAQLRYAIEENKGVVDASLRARLLMMPPVNAYHAAMSSGKAESHGVRHGTAIQKVDPLPNASTFYASPKKIPPDATPSFTLPAPKEAFPWASFS